ncbi:glycosyltransferase [Pseudomaricurvus sp.]|uniref:glycosyltransferase n=1 Tax=Pseudomaricurvus sp. TaxID=2004510 RepID=UPI003F6C629F
MRLQTIAAGNSAQITTRHSPARLKVAQVLAGAPYGGAEKFYLRLAEALTNQSGISQKAFTRHSPEREQSFAQAGIPAEYFRFGHSLNLLDRHRYQKALEEFSPDVVLTWMNRASGLTPSGPYTLVCRLGHYYNLKYYRHADYWIGITRGICDHLIHGGIPASRVFHIPNFADETKVSPLPRNSFNTPEDAPLLLAAGRLHTNKGFDVLLEALSRVPSAYLWLAGDGPEKQNLLKQARQLKLTERIRFLGWRADVTALMRTADIFVCPSRHEGLGSIVLEAWAHQCPIVATNSQGPGELIRDQQDGLLVPVDDSQALAKRLKSLLTDAAQRQTLAATAYQRYYHEFSRNIISNQYSDCLQSLPKSASPHPQPAKL